MSDRDFEIGGVQFKLGKLDAFKQFHIVRRMAPILGKLAPALGSIAGSTNSMSGMSETSKLEEIGKILAPVMEGLSELSDEDADRVLYGLLSSVEFQHAGVWSKVVQGTSLMNASLELPTLLQIAGRAFVYNLSGFFSALPRVS